MHPIGGNGVGRRPAYARIGYKKTCQLIFCSKSIKYKSSSIKIGTHVLEETLNKNG